jgi:hypothetical protein
MGNKETNMEYENIMHSATDMFADRGAQYGDMKATLTRQAKIATLILGRVITPYDVAMIMHAVKLGRLEGSRNKADTYIDGINYFAFAASFATAENETLEDDIAAMARRLAPRKQENANVENGSTDSRPDLINDDSSRG